MARAGLGLSVALLVVAAVLSVGTGSVEKGSPVLDVALGIVTLAFPVAGYVIATRRPQNPIGWLFIVFGVLEEAGIAAKEYALQGFVVSPGSLPGPSYAGWIQETLLGPMILLFLVFTLFLFPTGRLPSTRWRGPAWACVFVGITASILWALTPGPLLEQAVEVDNPVGVPALAGPLKVIDPVLIVAFQLAPLVALASAVVRFRRSSGIERTQMKWLAASVFVVATTVASAPPLLVGSFGPLLPVVLTVALSSVPIASAVAILRYRLYEIDRIVSRTVSYAVLTVMLGGIYAGLVFALGAVLPRGSDLSVAASTLTVAALFGPARRRVQTAVGRRFNRARYDAARTIDGFAAKLRDEINLDALGAELAETARRTLEPSEVSIWLRPRAAPL